MYEMTALLLEIKPETQRLVDNLLSLDECLEPCHKSGRWGDGRGREGGQRRTRGGIEEMRRGGGEGHHVKLTKARKSCLFSPHRNPNYPDNKSEVGGRGTDCGEGNGEKSREGRGSEKNGGGRGGEGEDRKKRRARERKRVDEKKGEMFYDK